MSAELAHLPSDPDAEQSVLGAMMLSRDATDDVTGVLSGRDFYQPAHELIYDAISHLAAGGLPVDARTVCDELTRRGELNRAGGAAYLHTCISNVPAPASAGYYAEIVRDRADSRAVVAAGTQMVQLGTALDASEAKARARKILDDLDTRDSAGMTRIGDVLEAVLEQAENGMAAAAPTPWPELDEKITGLRPGAVYTIGARTGLGKSVIGINMAWHMALSGKDAAIFSLEMSKEDVTRRILSAAARVDYGRLLRGNLHDVEWQRVSRAQATLLNAPLHIDDRSSITVADLRSKVRDLARRGDLGLIVVDYLQLMSTGRRSENRQQEVSELSRSLKVLAGDLKVPVVMLSQLSRKVEERHDKHPMLSDLRESGSLEQDSDVVLLLYRDDERAADVMEVGVAKNRMGPTTGLRLKWEGHFQRVVSEGREDRW